MLKRKTQKLLVMLLTVALAVTMIVPVSAAENQAQFVVSENQTFENFTSAYGEAGDWDIKQYNGVASATTDGALVSAVSSNLTIADHWFKKDTYKAEKIVLSFDVQTNSTSGGTLLQVFAGDGSKEVTSAGDRTFWFGLNDDGTLRVNNWTVTANTQIKNNTKYNLEFTFDMKAKTVTLKYKKDGDTAYTTFSTVSDFESTYASGDVLKCLKFFSPALASGETYSVDNVIISYALSSSTEESEVNDMEIMENQTFDNDVSGGWDQEGKWDIKSAKKNTSDETNTPLAVVENGKLVSKRTWLTNSSTIAEYNLKTESYGSKKIVLSFDVQAKNVNGTLIEVYAGDKANNPVSSGVLLYNLNLDKSSGYLYVNGWNDIAYTSLKDDAVCNLELTFDTVAETVALRYKKSTDADYTAHTQVSQFRNSLGENAIKRFCFGSDVIETGASYSIDNVIVSYKPEIKIEADLTVKDAEQTEITDLSNLPAGKRLTVTPVFKNTGKCKAKSVVLIVAWYGADNQLKDAFVEIDNNGLAVGASNSDLSTITFTADTEAGDYIKAFAWEGLTTLKPYNLVYAE